MQNPPRNPASSSADTPLPSVPLLQQHGFSCAWLPLSAGDTHLMHYCLRDMTRPSIDAWSAMNKAILSVWPAEQRFFSIQDFSATGMMLTPYMRQQSQEIAAMSGHIQGASAIITSSGITATLAQLFVAREIRRQQPLLERGFFGNFSEALAWLEEQSQNPPRLSKGREV